MIRKERTAILRRPHGEKMKKRIILLGFIYLCACFLSGCNISFSDGMNISESNSAESAEPSIPSGAITCETGNVIDVGNFQLTLPDGMKYGMSETETGKIYYVWKTDVEYVLPTDTDIIMYIYEGVDSSSPDDTLEDSQARYSIYQNYMQIFRESVDGKITADPSAVSNENWYVLQLTGYSGNYLTTSYGTLCYPKYYYGVYTLQKVTHNYTRDFYGFVFSNDSTGTIMNEEEYNSLYGQIKDCFSITEFYSAPQVEYDESKDFSKGYSYQQFSALFSDTANYYGMNAQLSNEDEAETAAPQSKETEE